MTSGATGDGNGKVRISITGNQSPSARTGTLTIAGQTYTINQEATDGCTYFVSPPSINLPYAAVSGSFGLNIPGFDGTPRCNWIAQSSADFLTTNMSGYFPTSIPFEITQNTGPARSAFIMVGGQTFTVNQAAALYTISGQITNNGNPLNGISVALSGAGSATVNTDANGNYSFNGLTAGGNFTVTPANTGLYSFTPQTVNNLQTNQTVNFTGTLRTYTVSGRVFASNGTTALQGVTVNLTGPTSASSVTDAAGNYSLTFNAGGIYTVRPQNTAIYSFGQLNLQGSTSNQTSNFVGTLNNYSISGQITRSGAPLAGVTVALSGTSTASTTTDGQGNYTFASVPAGGNYTVTPSLANHSFTPPNISISNLTANQTANFTATLNCTYSLSPTSANVAATTGSGSFNVTTQTGCAWMAQSSSSFLTTSSSGSSSGTVNYSYTANSGTARNATITIGGQTFTLNQAAAIVRRAPFDFDGDGKTDIGIFRPAPGEWWINYSAANQIFAVQFGAEATESLPAIIPATAKPTSLFSVRQTVSGMSREGKTFVLRLSVRFKRRRSRSCRL